MKWDEFQDLLIGLGPETPLGRIVSIRSENDKEVLKHFTKEYHRIRNAWRNRKAKEVKKEELAFTLEALKESFINIGKIVD